MNAADWEKIKETFNRAVELEPAQRAIFLAALSSESVSSEVGKLLIADQAENTFFNCLSLAPGDENYVNKIIGKYKIRREIGAGGMGSVFLASREDFEKQVALKIVKHEFSSKELRRRFETERQILATLEHPHIAHLLDGGTTESGLPYFVLEYVEGEDLLQFCGRRNLPVSEKLKLFRKICEAVSYAHSRLIVHRDLKPSNIIVNEKGEPKLLDFGISKLLSADEIVERGTVTSFGMMTPNYASPEQFRGESVTTATDIYSLGVILYQLLTDNLPYDINNRRLDQAARIVCATAPRKPSENSTYHASKKTNLKFVNQTSRLLRGDLDNIILKALRKEPERRYTSVEKFSDDLRRHLEGLPVTARPDTFGYRAEKFVKRNLVSLFSATMVFLLLLTGIIGVSWQYLRAERERKLAELRFSQVRKLANNVVFQYHDAISKLPGSTGIRQMIVSDATNYLDALARDEDNDASLQKELARAYLKIGDVNGESYAANLGDTESALGNYEKAAEIARVLSLKTPADAEIRELNSLALYQLGRLQTRRRKIAESIKCLEEAARLRRELLIAAPSPNAQQAKALARIYTALGDAHSRDSSVSAQERLDEGLKSYRQAAEFAESLSDSAGADGGDLRPAAVIYQRLGNILWQQAGYADKSDAEAVYRAAYENHSRATEIYRRLELEYPREVKNSRDYADQILMEAGVKIRFEPVQIVLRDCEKAIATMQRLAQGDEQNKEARFDLAMAYYQTSNLLQNTGKNLPQAIDFMRRATGELARIAAANPGDKEVAENLINGCGRLADMSRRGSSNAMFKKKSAACKF